MHSLLKQYLEEKKEIHVHLSRDFHLTGRLSSVGDGVISITRGNAVYHVPIDKIIYIFEQLSPEKPSKD